VPIYVVVVMSVFIVSLLFIFILFQRKQMMIYYNRCQLLLKQERELLSKISKDKNKLKHIKEDNLKLSDKFKAIEKSYSELQFSHKNFKNKTLSDIKELSVQKDNLERKSVHFEDQTKNLLSQLKEYSNESKVLRLRYESQNEKEKKSLEEICASQVKKIDTLSNYIKSSKVKIKKLENLVRKTAEVHSMDTKQAAQIQRKIKHYQQFYNTVVGQKEMLEERGKNWELALKLLSSWVIKTKGSNKQDAYQENNLGCLVAKALELTEQRPLVIDEYSQNISEKA
jgi:chromosome segregation ATPase